MTKSEIERLCIVETKMDDMLEGQVTLKEFLVEKIINLETSLVEKITAQDKAMSITMLGQEKAIGIAMTASEKAIVKAEIATDLRFTDVEKRFTDYVESINSSIKILTESKDVNAGAKTGQTESKTSLKDVIFYILFAITAISFIVSMYTR